MTTQRAATTTILFTDIVNSTQLMQRAGDEDAQRIFKAHYQLLRDAVSANGGAEVKSLGDGLMVAFTSAADAVRCAIMVQQASRRPVGGERLAVKVGINAGEAMSEGDDYFGTPVVVARRLCDRAGPGQILCSAVIESLLAGRQAFSFHDLGPLELKGIAAPVEAREVAYETNRAGVLLTRTPFVGRGKEMARLRAKLDEARAGHGGLVMLVGEPGIGKSRTIEEFAEQARAGGALVLVGRCFEGEWAPPYAPFVEAIAGYAKDADPDALRADLGYGAPPVARLVPSLRERLPDIGQPVPLNPDEERFRLLDAVSQFIIATSARAPVVLVLDDLHWADGGTIAMLRHVARFLPGQRTLVLGAYRDVELDRQHPLADALAALRSEAEYERILIKGLDEGEVRSLLTDIAEQDVPDEFVQAISAETDGNPFFIREVLIHLAEEGKIYQQDGRWASNVSIAEMGIPEGVRQVIGRRLSRLSENANRLLTAASGFNGGFRVGLAGDAAGLDEANALDAIDAALEAQLVQPAGDAESYDFAHALIRHTLYAELSPSRQVRLHREIAEAMERLYGDRAMEHAAELAYQYHRSGGLPGTERGADYAVAAADQAELIPAWDEVAVFSRMAMDLLPEADTRRAQAAGRLGLALAWSTGSDEAARACAEAADLIAKAKGTDSAADYFAEAVPALFAANVRAAWDLAARGMALIGDRRDASWAMLAWADSYRRDAEDPEDVGIPLLTEQRREIIRVFEQLPGAGGLAAVGTQITLHDFQNREDAMAEAAEVRPGRFADLQRALLLVYPVGDYRSGRELCQQRAERADREGDIAAGVSYWSHAARCCYALGEFDEGDAALARCEALAPRLTAASTAGLLAFAARATGGFVRGEFESLLAEVGARPAQPRPEEHWAAAALRAFGAALMSLNGHPDAALGLLASVIPALERAEGADPGYVLVACSAADTLWAAERTDHLDVIERNLRGKVVEPDFRYPAVDGRLSLARLCALSGRFEEASDWFARARAVLEEQGARPLRAVADHDEALMYARRAAEGDRERALPLLDAALAQFREIGMTGWVRRGEDLRLSMTLPEK
jgi:class 3 adenylate cyclase/tetratricopeptide (TPR) repeat protein